MSNPLFDELLRTTEELASVVADDWQTAERLSTDDLLEVLRHRELLEALYDEPLDRTGLESRLDVSRATSHRFTRWLLDHGLAERRDGTFHLTGEGVALAEEVVRFERGVRTTRRLGPLLDAICPDHREFVVAPFADATVTTATPDDPHAPLSRFLSLLAGTETLRAFNTTHIVPPGLTGAYDRLFAETEVEVISLPDTVEHLRERFPERVQRASETGHLTLRTREALPYGLAVFDDRVAIAGYDEETGAIRVLVDTDSEIARQWAERVYESYRERSEPVAV
ncbi:helix-turn-helix transcriptional regulator [Salinirubrum litoreum]|uniref:Helix-turn-helix transcriptional regulator n=1 Tax=Salinirubrum litoreum TaxID=1126234 RepID=A0ABD5R8X4_9EURY|nr:MarR family transcriptional regulator [Salinirubrum litoreum]